MQIVLGLDTFQNFQTESFTIDNNIIDIIFMFPVYRYALSEMKHLPVNVI